MVVLEWFWCSTLPWFPSLTPSIHKKYIDPWICEMNTSCFHLHVTFLMDRAARFLYTYRLHAKFRISKASQSGMYRGNGNEKNTCEYTDPTTCHYLKGIVKWQGRRGVSGINRIIMSLHTIADVLYAPKGLILRCKLQKTGFSVLCFPIVRLSSLNFCQNLWNLSHETVPLKVL